MYLLIDASFFLMSISTIDRYQSLNSSRLEGFFFSGGDLYFAISLAVVVVARVLCGDMGVLLLLVMIPFLGEDPWLLGAFLGNACFRARVFVGSRPSIWMLD
jgi:hypothetical protein